MPDDATHAATVPDSDRDDLVSRLKAEVAALTTASAQASARAEVFENRERQRIAAWQPDAQFVMKDFVKDEIDNYHQGTSFADDIAPLGVWSDEYTQKKEIGTQGALAAFSYVASKGIKRLREEASKHSAASEQLGVLMKENEALKANAEKMQRELNDSNALGAERQEALEKLNAVLAEKGFLAQQEKFDFSKATSREQVTPPAEPHMAAGMGGTPSLEAVKMQASKVAGGAATGKNSHYAIIILCSTHVNSIIKVPSFKIHPDSTPLKTIRKAPVSISSPI